MGEHLPCKQGVKGSIPFISTRDSIKYCSADRCGKEDRTIPGKEYGLIAQVVRARA